MHPAPAIRPLGSLCVPCHSVFELILQPLSSASHRSSRIQATERLELRGSIWWMLPQGAQRQWIDISTAHTEFFFCSLFCRFTVNAALNRHNRGCVSCDQHDKVQFRFGGPLGVELGSGQRHMFYYFIMCLTWHKHPHPPCESKVFYFFCVPFLFLANIKFSILKVL